MVKVIRNPTEIFGVRSNLYQMPKWLFWEGSKIGPPRFWGVFWCFGFETPKGFEVVFGHVQNTIPKRIGFLTAKKVQFWTSQNGKCFSDMSKNVQKGSKMYRHFDGTKNPKNPKKGQKTTLFWYPNN